MEKRLRATIPRVEADLLRYFTVRGFSREDAGDLVQQTFLEAVRSAELFRGNASLRGWIFGIAQNVYRSRVRTTRRSRNVAETLSIDDEDAHGDWRLEMAEPARALTESLARERRRLLRDAIGRLTPDQRDCLILRIDQGLSYREIADTLRISIDAVKTRLYAAKRTLRSCLHEQFELDA